MPKIKNKPGPKPKHLKLAGAPGGVAKVDGRTKAGRVAKARTQVSAVTVKVKSGPRQKRVLPAINVRVTKEQETFVNKAARRVLKETGVSKGDWIKELVFAEAARWVPPDLLLSEDEPEAVPEAAPEQVATPPVSVTPQAHPVVPLASQLQTQPTQAQAQAVPPTIRRQPEARPQPQLIPAFGLASPVQGQPPPILPRGAYPTVPPQLSQPAPGAPQGYVIRPPNGHAAQPPEGYEEINDQ